MSLLFADENFPLPVVEKLKVLGHDVLTIQEAGLGGQAIPDEQVLSLASSQKRALLTINRKDFIKLHKINSNHSGIIVCTFDPDFTRQAQRIHSAIKSQRTLANQLIRVNRPQS